LSRRRLVEFHTAHKLLLRAHNEAGYRRLGRIVASAGTIPDDELFRSYEDEFHGVLMNKATRKRHSNVLYHVLGYLKNVLDPFEKQEAVALIEDYRNDLVPLVVPITLLRHHIAKHGIEYMQGQLYLEPHPRELMLRNRV
ncbi:MAG: YbgA family protein, partial [Thermoanaerobaculales bacterium]|nr:YbgA family protein [Thermoanaerobaculales bacterium]